MTASYTTMGSAGPLRLGVVGAGIAGLCTAVQLQDALPSAQVTVIADKFDVETTSDGAAGSFRPTVDLVPGVPRPLLKQWCDDSFRYYSSLAQSTDASEAGIGVLPGYHFFINEDKEKDPLYNEVVYGYRPCLPREFEIFPGTKTARHGFSFTTLIVESRWFLPWLMKRFQSKGGKVQKRKLTSLQQLVGQFDVVVNCTGFGSAALLGDKLLQPSRGQMLRVKAPWIKHCLYIDHDCWIIPGKETVTIGGTRQVGETDLELRAADKDRVWNTACSYMPSLRKATIEWEWVGLRPLRNPLRLETELMRFGQHTLPVVHNYGHGGNGISLGWGTGKHACQLVLDTLKSSAQPKL